MRFRDTSVFYNRVKCTAHGDFAEPHGLRLHPFAEARIVRLLENPNCAAVCKVGNHHFDRIGSNIDTGIVRGL